MVAEKLPVVAACRRARTAQCEAAEAAYIAFIRDPANSGDETELEMINLGWSYLQMNEPDEAALIFELTTRSYPDSWRAYGGLGVAYEHLGRTDLAIQILEDSLAINPEYARVIERLRELRED